MRGLTANMIQSVDQFGHEDNDSGRAHQHNLPESSNFGHENEEDDEEIVSWLFLLEHRNSWQVFQVDIQTLLASVTSIYAQDQTNKTILDRTIYED